VSPKQVVDVLVFIFQGVIDEVRVLSHSKAEIAVIEWCKKHSYVSYQHFVVEQGLRILKDELKWFTDVTVEAD